MNGGRAFGWILLAIAVCVGFAAYRSWREEAATPRQVAVVVGLTVNVVAIVADVWLSY